MRLLATQKNELFDSIIYQGLEPSMFEYVSNSGMDSIKYRNSNFNFDFGDVSGYLLHCASYCPGENEYLDYIEFLYFNEAIILFEKWLKNLKREIGHEDKWEKLAAAITNIDINDPVKLNSKSFFTIQEYEILAIDFQTLKSKINEIDSLKDYCFEINNKLDHLLEMSKSLSKIDWKELFIGSIISLVMSLSIDKESINLIWVLIKEFFNGILMIK